MTEAPPVVDQVDGAGGELAAIQVGRRKAAPTPLVLQFVESILGISAISVKLAQRQHLVIEVGRQHGVLVVGGSFADLSICFDEAQQALAVLPLCDQHFILDSSVQHDDVPMRFPTRQTQRSVLAFPALTRIRPAGVPEQRFDVAFPVLRKRAA